MGDSESIRLDGRQRMAVAEAAARRILLCHASRDDVDRSCIPADDFSELINRFECHTRSYPFRSPQSDPHGRAFKRFINLFQAAVSHPRSSLQLARIFANERDRFRKGEGDFTAAVDKAFAQFVSGYQALLEASFIPGTLDARIAGAEAYLFWEIAVAVDDPDVERWLTTGNPAFLKTGTYIDRGQDGRQYYVSTLGRQELLGMYGTWFLDSSPLVLESTKLADVNLAGAGLKGVLLGSANLKWARLVGADLRRVDFCHADMSGADLTGADITGADVAFTRMSFGGCWETSTRTMVTAAQLRSADHHEYLLNSLRCANEARRARGGATTGHWYPRPVARTLSVSPIIGTGCNIVSGATTFVAPPVWNPTAFL